MSNTPSHNSLATVHTIMQHLAHSQIATWLFGGWAEQLHALCPPRPHHDIDIASIQALSLYRQKHQHIADAYHTYHQK